jgi:superfamily II DNA or RNA helicase
MGLRPTRLLEKGGQNFHLGVTATPKRADNKGLDDIFDVIAYSMGIRDGILQGYLCDIRGHTLVFENDDMDDVKMVGDDYNQGQLDKAVRKVARNEAIVEAWLEKAKLPDETYRH